jgi:YfiH family protein
MTVTLDPITHEALDAMPHGFFGRRGGVSEGLYGSLNCGLGSKDDPASVMENRARVGQALGADGAQVLTCHQVHSAEAVVVDAPWGAGGQPKADALVTRTPGLVLGALAADCMPILFADPKARVVAAAHAGWRGALAGIEASTVRAMETLGAERTRIRAIIGPCISAAAYQVGPEFHAAFLAVDAGFERYFTRPLGAEKPHFDLPAFMLDRLRALDLATVDWVGVCTYADDTRWFSYRRATHRSEADYGRQISVISLPR